MEIKIVTPDCFCHTCNNPLGNSENEKRAAVMMMVNRRNSLMARNVDNRELTEHLARFVNDKAKMQHLEKLRAESQIIANEIMDLTERVRAIDPWWIR